MTVATISMQVCFRAGCCDGTAGSQDSRKMYRSIGFQVLQSGSRADSVWGWQRLENTTYNINGDRKLQLLALKA